MRSQLTCYDSFSNGEQHPSLLPDHVVHVVEEEGTAATNRSLLQHVRRYLRRDPLIRLGSNRWENRQVESESRYSYSSLSSEARAHDSSSLQYLFIVYGSVTVAFGLLVTTILPSAPGTAWFLTPRERVRAVARLAENQQNVETKVGDPLFLPLSSRFFSLLASFLTLLR